MKPKKTVETTVIKRWENRWVFIACLSLMSLSIWVNATYHRLTIAEMYRGRSSAFQGAENQDPLAVPLPAEIIETGEFELPFQVTVPDTAQSLRVSFLYQCQPRCLQLWLSWQTNHTQPEWLRTLVHHPAITDLQWFFTAENDLIFYQKVPTYRSIDELINAKVSGVVTETTVARLKGWPLENFSFLEDLNHLSSKEYLITTHVPTVKISDWYPFVKLISLSNTLKNSQDQITFVLSQSTTAEKPALTKIGKFKVEFY